jgi:LAS superfamily LD-carboxypeptidase LdcB
MGNNRQPSIVRNRQELVVLEKCLAALKQMTLSLVQHDLWDLEQSLEQEAQLVAQLVILQESPSSSDARADRIEASFESMTPEEQEIDGFRAERLELLESLKRVAREIQAANALNSILVDNGLRFSDTLLSVICPPSSYRSLITHQPPIGAEVPVQSLISVQS